MNLISKWFKGHLSSAQLKVFEVSRTTKWNPSKCWLANGMELKRDGRRATYYDDRMACNLIVCRFLLVAFVSEASLLFELSDSYILPSDNIIAPGSLPWMRCSTYALFFACLSEMGFDIRCFSIIGDTLSEADAGKWKREWKWQSGAVWCYPSPSILFTNF